MIVLTSLFHFFFIYQYRLYSNMSYFRFLMFIALNHTINNTVSLLISQYLSIIILGQNINYCNHKIVWIRASICIITKKILDKSKRTIKKILQNIYQKNISPKKNPRKSNILGGGPIPKAPAVC